MTHIIKYRKNFLPVFLAVLGTYVGSAVFAGIIFLLTPVFNVVFSIMGFFIGLFSISHLLIHRFRFIEPFQYIKLIFLMSSALALIAALFFILQTLDSPNLDIGELVFGLVGLVLCPFVSVLPFVLALGDKPPPNDYP